MKPNLFKFIVSIELFTLFGIIALTWISSHYGTTLFSLLNISSIHSPAVSQNTESSGSGSSQNTNSENNSDGGDFIKWVDFQVTSEAMNDAYQYDLKSHDTDTPIDWVCLLAVLGVKYGGDFKNYKSSDMSAIADKILNKESTLEEITKDMKHYDYYNEAYHAVLGGFVGTYQISSEQTDLNSDLTKRNSDNNNTENVILNKVNHNDSNKNSTGNNTDNASFNKVNNNKTDSMKTTYGLKAFSPIAKGFPYTDYDDFGTSRSFGYRRQHLGHDMMGQIGTPIIAVESGYVECLGWNRYGGWRIGIRSFDKKRYYYYAHLRQNFPYNKALKEGSVVTAGDVIGYMGHTGYSDKENVNNIDIIHLHFGLQLIFDESQKDGNSEIWISCYELARFLSQNRSETVKDEATKEWHRTQNLIDPAVENYIQNASQNNTN